MCQGTNLFPLLIFSKNLKSVHKLNVDEIDPRPRDNLTAFIREEIVYVESAVNTVRKSNVFVHQCFSRSIVQISVCHLQIHFEVTLLKLRLRLVKKE